MRPFSIVMANVPLNNPDVHDALPVNEATSSDAPVATIRMAISASNTPMSSTASAVSAWVARAGRLVKMDLMVPQPYSLPAQLPPRTGQKKGAKKEQNARAVSQPRGNSKFPRPSRRVACPQKARTVSARSMSRITRGIQRFENFNHSNERYELIRIL